MKRLLVIETRRIHSETSAALQIQATEHHGQSVIFGYDPNQGELENHLEAALLLLNEMDVVAGFTGYGKIEPLRFVFITDAEATA